MVNKTVNLNIRINEEARDKLKKKARQLGTTYSELINRWIEDFVGEGEESPSLLNDKQDSNDISEQIEKLREEMRREVEEKLESLRRGYQYNDEQYSNDIKTHLSQIEGELEEKESAIGSLQERLTELGEEMEKNMYGTICDPFKMEPQPAKEEVDDQEEVKQEETQTEPKYKELNQAELARRLKVSAGTVKNRIREGKDERWSKRRDPDGLIWKFDEDKKTYRAIVSNTN